jgi:MFS family permease
MRLLVGVAEAVVIPASYRWIRNNFEESRNGLAVGIFAMGNKFGPAIGAPDGGLADRQLLMAGDVRGYGGGAGGWCHGCWRCPTTCPRPRIAPKSAARPAA